MALTVTPANERAVAAQITPLYGCAVRNCAEESSFPASELRWAESANGESGFYCNDCIYHGFDDELDGGFVTGRTLAEVLTEIGRRNRQRGGVG